MKKKFFISCLLCLVISCEVVAELHSSATLQNMHLWRGIEVSDGLVLTTEVSVSDRSECIHVGLWGGTNATGTYKEFNHYVSYSHRGFSLSFWDTYNFSPGAVYNNREYFNYRSRETGRFLDGIVSYGLSGKVPLRLTWSTILFGRDRDAGNTANKYSTFCYAEYPVYRSDVWAVDGGIGGAFALNRVGGSSHFYGDRPGIVHITVRVSRTLRLGGWTIPLFTCGMWNPLEDSGFLQFGAQLFSF